MWENYIYYDTTAHESRWCDSEPRKNNAGPQISGNLLNITSSEQTQWCQLLFQNMDSYTVSYLGTNAPKILNVYKNVKIHLQVIAQLSNRTSA